MAELRKYGAATTVNFPLITAGAVDFETGATFAATDTKIRKDEGASANSTNTPVHEGEGIYSLALTATEMQAARVTVTIIDAATKVWEDQAVVIDTYGNASAEHAVDLDDSVRAGLTALPNAAADAAGGLPISDLGGLDMDAVGTGAARALTALPNAAADAAGGLPISDAGGLDIDSLLGTLTSLAAETRDANVLDQFKRTLATIEHLRPSHTGQPIGNIFFVDPVNGGTHAGGNRGGITDPYLTIQDCHDNAVTDSNHDVIYLLSGAAAGATTHTVAATTTISKRYVFIRGPGRDFIITRTGAGNTLAVTADGVELSGFQLNTAATGSGNGIQLTDADFLRVENVWINATQGDGINILRGENCQIVNNVFTDTGAGGSGQGIDILGTAGSSDNNVIRDNLFRDCQGDAIQISGGTTNNTTIQGNTIEGSTAWGIDIGASSTDAVVTDNRLGNNTSGAIQDNGTTTVSENNEQWAKAGATVDDLDDLPTAPEIATETWDEPTVNLITVGSVGELVVNTKVDTAGILNRIGAFTGTGINTILGFFQALMRSDASAPSDLGGTYDPSTDSLEANAGGGGGGNTKNGFVGIVTRDSGTYYVSGWLMFDGAVIAGGSLSVISTTFYQGGSALTYSGSPAADASGEVRANGTITEAVSDDQPVTCVLQATYAGDVYSTPLPAVAIA